MRKLYIIPLLIIASGLAYGAYVTLSGSLTSSAPTCRVRILNTYPHDPNAFTEGLVYDGGFLYESTGLYGSSTLRCENLTTGEVLQRVDLPSEYFGEGMAIVGDRIYQLTYCEGIGFVYGKSNFTVLSTFTYSTEGWGLTYDGSRLIMSDGSENLYFLDPSTLAKSGQVTVTDGSTKVTQLNELEYVDGLVYANVFTTTRVAVINPANGSVVAWLDLSSLPGPAYPDVNSVLNGIAYDRTTRRLFVTGKNWPSLYEIEIVR